MTLTRIALVTGFFALAGCGGGKQATMDAAIIWALMLGTLSILLGFIALLTSRIYVDKDSNTPVEVEVPFFGKLKGNYPALVFVLLGAALAYAGLTTHADLVKQGIEAEKQVAASRAGAPGDEEWVISGSLVAPGDKRIDWERGVFTLIAGSPAVHHKPGGRFEIKLRIRRGEDFEGYVQQIDYSHDAGSAKIFPKDELDAFKANQSSLLQNQTATTRVYKPLKLEAFGQ